jgi:hypothetical protein
MQPQMSAEFTPIAASVTPAAPSLLAVLPNGEAVRAQSVRAILIEELVGLHGQEEPRFKVVVELDDGGRRIVAVDQSAQDATDTARRTGRLVNDVLRSA